MRWAALVSLTAMLLAVSGCRALGPFSPFRPLEQLLVYPQSVAPFSPFYEDAGGQPVWINSGTNDRIDARYFAHPNPQAVVLYCHGNVGTVDKWAILVGRLSKLHRVSILVFDYRGYGRSSGIAHERAVFEDAQAARNWLANENGIHPSDVVLMGRSLGGAVAVDLAANGGARGLILESTFSSLPDVARQHVPLLFPDWNMTQRMNSVEKIRNYQGPVFQSHGDTDRLIPLALGKELYAAAPGPKRFVIVPDATHNDDHIRDCAVEREQFLRNLPPPMSQTVMLPPREFILTSYHE
ncbi:alpha/beta hydrolase [Schlesneria sp. T3-172]|uniref:alpha/beta hydrolase n=1 Tax=Schlesneria TaxID=656899 RepID=UPI002EDC52A1